MAFKKKEEKNVKFLVKLFFGGSALRLNLTLVCLSSELPVHGDGCVSVQRHPRGTQGRAEVSHDPLSWQNYPGEPVLTRSVQLIAGICFWDGRVGFKGSQIVPKLDKSGSFSDQISVDFVLSSQNVMKSDLKNTRNCPFWGQSDSLWDQLLHLWFVSIFNLGYEFHQWYLLSYAVMIFLLFK